MATRPASIEPLAKKYIEAASNDEQKSLVGNLSDIISARNSANLLDLVEGLGVYLTNEDVSQRRKGSQLLAELMHRLEPDILNGEESKLLTMFFIDRLKDHHSIQPQVIYGLLGLVSYFSPSDENVIQICQAIFSEVHVRSLVQADRRNIFNLFANLLEKYLKPLRRMGPDFVLGFIQSMDGEKDPRNLLVCFQNVQEVISKLSFEVFAEDLFEVTSCYFPIDFSPPQNDPHGITKQQLVCQLRKCLASTSIFAPYCLPLLMEKITSDVVDAKIDAYLTLAECTKVYKAEDMKEYSQDLWGSIRGDYLLGGVKAIEGACMKALQGTVACLSRNKEICSSFVEAVFLECEQALKDPDLNLQEELGQVFSSLIFSCKDVFEMSFPQIIKVLGSLLNGNQSKSHTAAVMKIFHVLLEHPSLSHQDGPLIGSVFSSEKHIIAYFLATLSSTLADFVLICYSLECLLVLLSHGCLSKSDQAVYFDAIVKQVSTSCDERVLTSVYKCMSIICERNMQPMPGYLSNLLQANIKDCLSSQNFSNSTDVMRTKHNIDALFATLHTMEDATTAVKNLFEDFPTINLESIHAEILQFVIRVLEKFPKAADEIECWFIAMLLKIMENDRKMSNDKCPIWHCLLALFTGVISSLSCQVHDKWLKELVNQYILKRINLAEDSWSYSVERKDMEFISSFLCAAKEPLKINGLQNIINWLQHNILETLDSLTAEYGCKSCASLLNKMPEGKDLSQSLTEVCGKIDKVISDGETVINKKENASLMLLWITKSVVLRWNDQAPVLLTRILSLISVEGVGRYCCQKMYILIKDYDDCLNKKLHCKHRIMYKQRLVDFLLPKLLVMHRKGNDITMSSIAKAISCLFQELPKQVVQKKILSMIPLLIHSLSTSDVTVLSSTLSTFNSLESPEVLQNHVTSIIPRLLSLTSAPESMSVRVQAIRCLKFLSRLPVHCIYPYQMKVIRCLRSCLDDKKRLVRKDACKCRNKWFLLTPAD